MGCGGCTEYSVYLWGRLVVTVLGSLCNYVAVIGRTARVGLLITAATIVDGREAEGEGQAMPAVVAKLMPW